MVKQLLKNIRDNVPTTAVLSSPIISKFAINLQVFLPKVLHVALPFLLDLTCKNMKKLYFFLSRLLVYDGQLKNYLCQKKCIFKLK